ncbi:hypothetical protein MJO55_21835 [Mycolicibacterium rufum]|uniref:DUF4189 domain-containing protein n=1 Tax=Mycolicibacterium rufum TaxID=318424 RepID=A0A9X2YII2_9MYCO|nr:hypothetical protein [Mycolicibacterium rufum]KGI69628.1 hypothetical protein EU78_21765 [Mycolicibacterium rufum]MCV7073860.1 hypothetical protein [Mycolicibacterium rufum]ULP35862.1 hypothetical protein MJO55_21835 [Mycolicibacterium rufum]
MARVPGISAGLLMAVSMAVAVAIPAPAWAGGPGGVVDTGVVSRAVGSGVRDGLLVGFTATGPTNEMAASAVIAACQAAGAQQCSSDEQTNDVFCIASVGADDGSGIVSGGAGPTPEAAREDAFRHVASANLTLAPSARILASSCP